jgi:GTP pyrophosphokinase
MNLESYINKLGALNEGLDLKNIIKAYNFSEEAHKGQLRKSGERYFIHPVEVSLILAELMLDESTIIAGLLHDVIEDTKFSYKDLVHEFGKDVAELVEGVTKLDKIQYETKEELQAENLRKMLIAIAKDIRVILIKLADRLHNMRTLKFVPDEKKKEKAKETLEIFAPIAHRLGISRIQWELEDLSLFYLEPVKYYDLVNKVNKKREEREFIINGVIEKITKELHDFGITCDIYGRPKSFYSIFKKMEYQNKNFEEIYDLTAIRIIVDSVKDCYGSLGVVHTLWRPIPGRFKDFIAMPKTNMYQSLHTTVISDTGEPFEIQIRTADMHKVAEFGIAAHWMYKEKKDIADDLGEKLTWVRQMMEYQKEMDNPSEFMESIKLDLFDSQVYVFTPEGKIIELPDGSSPIDFAYKIHSHVGNKCVGAKVNSRMVTLNYKLQNGDIVEILTSNHSNGPSRDWLKFVKSTQAKNKIKSFFKKERKEENIEKGKEILDRELKRNNFPLKEVLSEDFLEEILQKLSVKNLEDLYSAVGYGGISTAQVIPKIREKYKELYQKEQPKQVFINNNDNKKKSVSTQGVNVKGIDDVLVRFAKCCSPVPGDKIIGYVTRGRGVTVHRADCTNFEKTQDSNNRIIEVSWQTGEDTTYHSDIQVIAHDRRGLLSDITNLLAESSMAVRGLNAKVSNDKIATITLSVEIEHIDQLSKLLNKIKNLKEIIDVKRVSS